MKSWPEGRRLHMKETLGSGRSDGTIRGHSVYNARYPVSGG